MEVNEKPKENSNLLTLINNLEKAGYEVDIINYVKDLFKKQHQQEDLSFLMQLPEALNPELYYFWVEKCGRTYNPDQLKGWHVQRAINIDDKIGDLMCCFSLLRLGLDKSNLYKLKNTIKRVEWFIQLNNLQFILDMENDADPLKEATNFSLKSFLTISRYDILKKVYNLILRGSSPELLLDIILSEHEELRKGKQAYYVLLNFPPDPNHIERKYHQVYNNDIELKFIKACFLSLICCDSPSAQHIHSIINLLTLYTQLDVNNAPRINIGLKVEQMSAKYILEIKNKQSFYPFILFFNQHVQSFEAMEELGYKFPDLNTRLYRTLAGTGKQHRLWCIGLIRQVIPKIKSTQKCMQLWKALLSLKSNGYFGPVNSKQICQYFLEALMEFEKFDMFQFIIKEEELPMNLDEIIELAINVSKELFDNQTDLKDLNSLESSLKCLEGFETNEAVILWEQFMYAAHELATLYNQFKIQLPQPLEIRLYTQQQFNNLLYHTKSTLYKDYDLVEHLIQDLNINIESEYSIKLLLIDIAIFKKEFNYAFELCIQLFEMGYNEDNFNSFINLIKHQEFKDINKKKHLISMVISNCNSNQVVELLNYYRELEIASFSSSLQFSQAIDKWKQLFNSNQISEINNDISQLYSEINMQEQKNVHLIEYPNFNSDLDYTKDYIYNGEWKLNSKERLIRLFLLVLDSNPQFEEILKGFIKKVKLEMCDDIASSLAQYHLFSLVKEDKITFFNSIEENSINAIWKAFHFGLDYFYYQNLESVQDLSLIKPKHILNLIHTTSIPKDLNEADSNSLKVSKDSLNSTQSLDHQNDVNKLLDKLKINSIEFRNQNQAQQEQILINKVHTYDAFQLDLTLKLVQEFGFDYQQFILIYLKYLFLNQHDINDLNQFYYNHIQQYLDEFKMDLLAKKELNRIYEDIEGTDLIKLNLFFSCYGDLIDQDKECDEKDRIKIVNQIILRTDLLNNFNLNNPGNLDFKLFLNLLFDKQFHQLQSIFDLMLDEINIESLLFKVEDLLKLLPIFENENQIQPMKHVDEQEILKSHIIKCYILKTINNIINKEGIVLPEEIIKMSTYLSNMNLEDSLQLVLYLNQSQFNETLPLLTQQELIKIVSEAITNKHNEEQIQRYHKDIQPLNIRLQFLEELHDLIDPITQEDLGFILIKRFDIVDKQDVEEVKVLLIQLIIENISLWLIYQTTFILFKYYPNCINKDWKEYFKKPIQFDDINNNSDNPILLNLLQYSLIYNDNINKDQGLILIKQIVDNLKKYNEYSFGQNNINNIQQYLFKEVINNNNNSINFRLNVLFILYSHLNMNQFDDIELLLEAYCNLLIQFYFPKLEDKFEQFLDDFNQHQDIIQTLLNYKVQDDNNKFKVIILLMIIFCKYYQLSTASNLLNIQYNNLWFIILKSMIQSNTINSDLIYKLWIYLYDSLDLMFLQKNEQLILNEMKNYQILTYFRIGLYSNNNLIFDNIINEFYKIDHYDFGLENDFIIISLIIIRHQLPQLILNCKNLYHEDVQPLLFNELDIPIIYDTAIRDLSLDFSNETLMLEAEHLLNNNNKKNLSKLIKNVLKSKRDTLIDYLRKDPIQYNSSNHPLPSKLDNNIPTLDQLAQLLNPDLKLPFEEHEFMRYIWEVINRYGTL